MADCVAVEKNKPRPAWTGRAVGLMHIYRITQDELCAKTGYARQYVSELLIGRRNPPDCESKILNAISQIIEQKLSSGELIEE